MCFSWTQIVVNKYQTTCKKLDKIPPTLNALKEVRYELPTFLFGVSRDGGVSMYSLMHWRFLFSLCSSKLFPSLSFFWEKVNLHDEFIGTYLAELTWPNHKLGWSSWGVGTVSFNHYILDNSSIVSQPHGK